MTGQRTPPVLAAAAGLAVVFLVLPVIGLLVRVPWSSLLRDLTHPATVTALRLSLECSVAALAICLVLGVPLAWVLARRAFPGRAVIRAAVILPLVLPPVVGGVALLAGLGRSGVAGPLLSALGLRLPFTTTAAVLSEAFVAMPFLVLAVEGALRAADTRHEEVAATLGAGPWATFRHVTLPLLAPAVAAGAALAWARALGEFGATVTFAGDLPGRTETLPLAVYSQLQDDPGAAYCTSLLLLVVSLVVLVALRQRWWR